MIAASQENIKEGNVIICFIHVNGVRQVYDCNVLSVNEKGASIVYLEGYKSRNDFVFFENIAAKVDRRRKRISVANNAFEGRFIEFKSK